MHILQWNIGKNGSILLNCQDQKAGEIVMYQIKAGGGLNRMKFVFDGETNGDSGDDRRMESGGKTCSYGNDPYPHQKMELY